MNRQSAKEFRRQAESLRQEGKLVDALRILDKLVSSVFSSVDDWYWTGSLLNEIGEFAKALGALQHCLDLDSNHHAANYELGRALYNLGDSQRAVQYIEKVAKQTHSASIWEGLASIAPGDPDCDGHHLRQIRETYASFVRAQEQPLLPALESSAKSTNNSTKGRRLRIGYVSAHWHHANYMKPVWPTVNSHNTEKYEILLFDDTRRLPKGLVANWDWLVNPEIVHHAMTGLSNREAAIFLRSLHIDVLVDLSAFSCPDRLGLFVHRPAHIQAAWFNMYATSGFSEIDFLIADPFVVRPGEEDHYVEKIVKLPISYLTFQTNHSAPEVALRREADDRESSLALQRPFHFGCLGTMYKMTSEVLDSWSAIMLGAPNSRLVIANRELKSVCNRDYFVDQLSRRGIAPSRLSFLPPANHFEFLKYYDQIDLALDTFPYNGGTTTMEAIWQGVPVLTFSGDRWASRTSQSLLAQTHLSELIMSDVQQYIQSGIRFATDPERRKYLAELRPTMRESLMATTVTQSHRLAEELEALYDAMMTARA